MADVYLYADETGNLDYKPNSKAGTSPYFGFGTAVFDRDHGDELWAGLRLRAEMESRGLNLKKGFHAVDDSNPTRDAMYTEIARQAPRFDATFLCKPNAFPRVKERGDMYLYQMAWYQHFKYVAPQVAQRRDTLYVIAGSFGTRTRQTQATNALKDVCWQMNLNVVLCVWEASTSWGLQVADYGLWAIHRDLMGRSCYWYGAAIEPTVRSVFTPWGRHSTGDTNVPAIPS